MNQKPQKMGMCCFTMVQPTSLRLCTCAMGDTTSVAMLQGHVEQTDCGKGKYLTVKVIQIPILTTSSAMFTTFYIT